MSDEVIDIVEDRPDEVSDNQIAVANTQQVATPDPKKMVSIENQTENSFSQAPMQELKCDNCALRPFDEGTHARCEHFAVGNACYYQSVKIKTTGDVADMYNRALEVAFNRFFKAALLEKMDGGVLDKAVSDELRRLADVINAYRHLTSSGDVNRISIEAAGSKGTSVLGNLLKDIMS